MQGNDIIQPDVCAAGGLAEEKIADMANPFGVRCVLHVRGGVGLAAALQLIAVLADKPRHTPLAPMLEFDRSEHPFRRAAPIEADAGMVVPEAVGLGIATDRGALARFRKTPDRR